MNQKVDSNLSLFVKPLNTKYALIIIVGDVISPNYCIIIKQVRIMIETIETITTTEIPDPQDDETYAIWDGTNYFYIKDLEE